MPFGCGPLAGTANPLRENAAVAPTHRPTLGADGHRGPQTANWADWGGGGLGTNTNTQHLA
eukprot:11200206-Lingulodinium_polyedra.AAC.1